MNSLSRTTYKDNHSKGNQHLILLMNIVRMDCFGPDRPDPGRRSIRALSRLRPWKRRENPHEIVTVISINQTVNKH